MKAAAVHPSLYFRLTWQVEIALVGALLIASDVINTVLVAPFLILSLVLTSSVGARLAPWFRVMRIAVAAGIFAVLADLYLSYQGFESVIEALIALICGGLPLLLMTVDRPRSYWLATLNISVIAVGSVTLSSSPAVYLAFIAFMVVLLFNLNAANIHLPDAAGLRLRDDLPRGYFRQFLFVIPIGLIAAALIFVAFPRARSLSFGLNLGLKSRIGYTGAITLEGAGEIELSEEVAFMVKTPDTGWLTRQAPAGLFRGDALDTFDGKRWSSTVEAVATRTQQHDFRSTVDLGPVVREMTVFREPTHDMTLFYPGALVGVAGMKLGFGEISVKDNGTVQRRKFGSEGFEYLVRFTDLPPLPALALRPLVELAKAVKEPAVARPVQTSLAVPSPEDLGTNLALPPEVDGSAYFAAWREELNVDPARQSLADVVKLLSGHFRSEFEASLANKFSDENTLAAFLTTDRRGHCEYFATATALYLRSLGVPARIIVGYKGGTYNGYIDLLEIREGNAHAWVEAYIPGGGWFPVDVTPATLEFSTSLGSAFQLYANALSFWFRQYVVDYNFQSQRNLVKSIRNFASEGQDRDRRDWLAFAKRRVVPLAVGGGILLVALAVTLRRRRRRGSGLPAYYDEFAVLLRELGHERQAGETFSQFHARINGYLGDEGPSLVHAVDLALERELYAAQPLEESAAAELRRAIGAVRRRSREA